MDKWVGGWVNNTHTSLTDIHILSSQTYSFSHIHTSLTDTHTLPLHTFLPQIHPYHMLTHTFTGTHTLTYSHTYFHSTSLTNISLLIVLSSRRAQGCSDQSRLNPQRGDSEKPSWRKCPLRLT